MTVPRACPTHTTAAFAYLLLRGDAVFPARSAGYYVRAHIPRQAARMGMRALKAYPELAGSPHKVHQLAYSLLGANVLYATARRLYQGRGARTAQDFLDRS
jgi:hypothetical protein